MVLARDPSKWSGRQDSNLRHIRGLTPVPQRHMQFGRILCGPAGTCLGLP